MQTLEQVAHRCDKVRWQGKDTFTACCVAHDDKNPSMSVSERDGMILAYCHSGCPQDDVISALGILLDGKQDRDFIPRPTYRKEPDTSSTEARSKRAVELATLAPDNHPYLVRKGIQAHGVGLLGELYKDLPSPIRNKGNVLVIPMVNAHGRVYSCQFIAEDGSKAYMSGPKRKGGFYHIKGNGRLWVCEGFATAASLHEDTGDSVACSFDAGGLMAVTDGLTALYPKREIIIMADDDWKTEGNTGMAKATAAAEMCGTKVLCPNFNGLNRGDKDTDYNDYVRLRDGS